jgi:hypothetical protein
MSYFERHCPPESRDKGAYVVNGLPSSALIYAEHALVSAGDIVAGMKIRLDDGALATVLSAHSYRTDAQLVNVLTGYGEMSLCADAYFAYAHPMCELYFGSSEVAYPIKAMVGYAPTFSWHPRTELFECISLELDQIGWVRINGLSAYIPSVSLCTNVARQNTTPNEETFRRTPSLHNKLILTPEETIVLSTFNCALTGIVPTFGTNDAFSEYQWGGGK